MHAVSTNQIADILHFNDKCFYLNQSGLSFFLVDPIIQLINLPYILFNIEKH